MYLEKAEEILRNPAVQSTIEEFAKKTGAKPPNFGDLRSLLICGLKATTSSERNHSDRDIEEILQETVRLGLEHRTFDLEKETEIRIINTMLNLPKRKEQLQDVLNIKPEGEAFELALLGVIVVNSIKTYLERNVTRH